MPYWPVVLSVRKMNQGCWNMPMPLPLWYFSRSSHSVCAHFIKRNFTFMSFTLKERYIFQTALVLCMWIYNNTEMNLQIYPSLLTVRGISSTYLFYELSFLAFLINWWGIHLFKTDYLRCSVIGLHTTGLHKWSKTQLPLRVGGCCTVTQRHRGSAVSANAKAGERLLACGQQYVTVWNCFQACDLSRGEGAGFNLITAVISHRNSSFCSSWSKSVRALLFLKSKVTAETAQRSLQAQMKEEWKNSHKNSMEWTDQDSWASLIRMYGVLIS